MRRSKYLQFLDAKFEREFGPKLRQLREINRLAATGKISEQERLTLHERLFPGFSKVERLEGASERGCSAKSA
jgi:hypothetical protein